MTIFEWLSKTKEQFRGTADFSLLDLELILCHVLSVDDRSFLVLHENDSMSDSQIAKADKLAERRFADAEPLAYILSEKEFYGRKFYVDKRVLIPRPETETLVEAVKELVLGINADKLRILDVGAGSGVLAITLKKEIKNVDVSAVDISKDALLVAKRNARDLGVEIDFYQSDLLENVEKFPDIIVANLPYVDKNWSWTSKNLRFEPRKALFAEDNGLAIIKRLITELTERMLRDVVAKKEVFLLLELDPSQKTVLEKFVRGVNNKGKIKLQKIEFKNCSDFMLGYKITRRKSVC